MDSRLLRTIIAALTLACVEGIAVASQGNSEAAKMVNPVAATPESVAAGQQIFMRNCATCHGINAEGGPGNDLIPAAPDLTDATWDHGSTDGEVFDAIQERRRAGLQHDPVEGQVEGSGCVDCEAVYFESGSGRIWNFTSLLVLPLPPSA